MATLEQTSPDRLHDDFLGFLRDGSFPCVGAKSAAATGGIEIVPARRIDSAWNDLKIHDALLEWAWRYRDDDDDGFRSLVVIFEGPCDLSEAEFEDAMWARIQSLADKDAWRGQSYDPRVSADAADPKFSLSFGGEAFFVVGLHPNASRPARRTRGRRSMRSSSTAAASMWWSTTQACTVAERFIG